MLVEKKRNVPISKKHLLKTYDSMERRWGKKPQSFTRVKLGDLETNAKAVAQRLLFRKLVLSNQKKFKKIPKEARNELNKISIFQEKFIPGEHRHGRLYYKSTFATLLNFVRLAGKENAKAVGVFFAKKTGEVLEKKVRPVFRHDKIDSDVFGNAIIGLKGNFLRLVELAENPSVALSNLNHLVRNTQENIDAVKKEIATESDPKAKRLLQSFVSKIERDSEEAKAAYEKYAKIFH